MPWLSENTMWEAFGARTLMHSAYAPFFAPARNERLTANSAAEHEALVPFTVAEGAGGHCEGAGRRLYHQRVYDWLDATLAAA